MQIKRFWSTTLKSKLLYQTAQRKCEIFFFTVSYSFLFLFLTNNFSVLQNCVFYSETTRIAPTGPTTSLPFQRANSVRISLLSPVSTTGNTKESYSETQHYFHSINIKRGRKSIKYSLVGDWQGIENIWRTEVNIRDKRFPVLTSATVSAWFWKVRMLRYCVSSRGDTVSLSPNGTWRYVSHYFSFLLQFLLFFILLLLSRSNME